MIGVCSKLIVLFVLNFSLSFYAEEFVTTGYLIKIFHRQPWLWIWVQWLRLTRLCGDTSVRAYAVWHPCCPGHPHFTTPHRYTKHLINSGVRFSAMKANQSFHMNFDLTWFTGECSSGRQSLMEAAAHIAGRFLLTFSLSPFTSVAALSSMLTGNCQAEQSFRIGILSCYKINELSG